MGIVSRELMEAQKKQAEASGESGEEGANALNGMMALMTGESGDAVACHPLMTERIAESSEAMDIICLLYTSSD